jgi:hypothetical protein
MIELVSYNGEFSSSSVWCYRFEKKEWKWIKSQEIKLEQTCQNRPWSFESKYQVVVVVDVAAS